MAKQNSNASGSADSQRDGGRRKKRKKPTAPRWPLYAAIAGGGAFVGLLIIGLCIVGVVFGMKAIRGAPAEPVAEWDRFSTAENEFAFDYPKGWNVRAYGIKDKREVNVTNAGVSITVKENLTGSLVADISNAANQGKEVSDDLSPVAKVHETRKPEGAKEDPAVTVTTKTGKARRSFYKSGGRCGYRATVLLHQTALDVFCECRESDWETLRPAFERLIESIGRGG